MDGIGMNTTQLKTFLTLDRTSPSSLHSQAYEGLRGWVTVLQPGQRLPSERELAALARVDRTTIKKAISRLVREGTLMRNVKGTFKVQTPEDPGKQPHPFALSTSRIPTPISLRIALFENWPTQQVVWTRIVKLFNQAHPDLRLEIEWLPSEVNTLDRYKEYIRSQRPDVVLLSCQFAEKMQPDDMLARLPDDLTQALRGAAYHSEILSSADDALLPYTVPMHFAPWGLLWNEDLVGDFDKAILPDLNQAKLVPWLGMVAKRLPHDCHLLVEPWSLPFASGFPVKSMTEEKFEQLFHDSFAAMEALQGLSDRCLWVETHPLQGLKLFLEGQAAFYLSGLNHIFNTIPASRIRWKGAFVVPEAGCCLPTAWNGVSIPRVSSHPDLATKIIRFLASPRAQDEIAAGHINAAFHKASNRLLLPFVRGSTESNFHAAFQRLYSDSDQTNDGLDFIGGDLRFLFREVMEGQRPVPDAVNLAMEMTRRKFGPFVGAELAPATP